jgi:hypothetical protein
MTKYDRTLSSTEVTRETTENLYELGLLNRPRSRSGSVTSESKKAQCKVPLPTKSPACAQSQWRRVVSEPRQRPRTDI